MLLNTKEVRSCESEFDERHAAPPFPSGSVLGENGTITGKEVRRDWHHVVASPAGIQGNDCSKIRAQFTDFYEAGRTPRKKFFSSLRHIENIKGKVSPRIKSQPQIRSANRSGHTIVEQFQYRSRAQASTSFRVRGPKVALST